MGKGKKVKQKGKIRLSEYFKELKKDDRVALKREKSFSADFPKRMQGKTGIISGKRGASYVVKVKDFDREKTYIVPAIHLIRIYDKPKAVVKKDK